VGAYAPRWFMGSQHVDPAEAIKIHQDIKATTSLGIHWGTFELTDEPLDEPPKQLATERAKAGIAPERFFVVKHGEMVKIGR
jgi:N-acyl-phosphatidylethanolamine-hydrolysing phospholipase D